MLPKITVVTPSYNQAAFIEATLKSIHDQNYPNLEHIVIDGASNDGTVDVIERYTDRLSYWVSEPDKGQTDALIKGFNRSTGDIQCWLNTDDLFEPWTLREVGEIFEGHPEAQFVFGDATWIDAWGRVIKPKREHPFNRFIWMYDHNYLPQPSCFWRRDLYERVGGLDPAFDLAMDADLWIRFADITKPRHQRRLWSRMRFHPEQKNTKLRAASAVEGQTIRARYGRPLSYEDFKWKRRLARSMRVGLKLITGCYPPSEVARHLGTLFGRGTWEAQEAAQAELKARRD